MKRTKLARAGFTLVELMIALAAGSFAVAGVYYLGAMSARAYNDQMRISDTQLSLRLAMEQLRRDLGRAGFMGARNVNGPDHVDCSGTQSDEIADGARIQGIEITANGSLGTAVDAVLDTANNPTRVDLVRVWGNYMTSDSYRVFANSDPSRQTLQFQTGYDSFRRSFVDPGVGATPPTYNEGRFQAAFTGRWVRVEHKGKFWFRRVASVTPSTATITVDPPLPACFDYTGAIVSPITRVAYLVDQIAEGGPLARLRGADTAGSNRAVLLRREEDIVTGDAIDGTERLVLDFVVEFAVDAIYDSNAAVPNAAPNFAYVTPASAPDLGTLSLNNPEQFRALRLTLSARSPEANPRLPRLQRASVTDPFLAFRVPVAGAPDGAEFWAQVRTLRGEIFLPNLMQRPR